MGPRKETAPGGGLGQGYRVSFIFFGISRIRKSGRLTPLQEWRDLSVIFGQPGRTARDGRPGGAKGNEQMTRRLGWRWSSRSSSVGQLRAGQFDCVARFRCLRGDLNGDVDTHLGLDEARELVLWYTHL